MAKVTKAMLEDENTILKEIVEAMKKILVDNGLEDELNVLNDNHLYIIMKEPMICADAMLSNIQDYLQFIKDDESAEFVELYNQIIGENIEYDDVDWHGC